MHTIERNPLNDAIPIVVCFKWGEKYPCQYTNILFRVLTDLVRVPFKFVCVTDDSNGLDQGIETLSIPEFKLPREHWKGGMWPKLAAFKPGLFLDGSPVLLLDVDIMVAKDISPMFAHLIDHPGIYTIQGWLGLIERWVNKPGVNTRGSNSSVVGFIAGAPACDRLWTAFCTKSNDELLQIANNDQEFIDAVYPARKFWPTDWVASFKKTLCKVRLRTLFGVVEYPSNAYIVAFHGKPNPEDLVQRPFRRWGSNEIFGFFPVKWMKEYWSRYAD